MQRGCIVSTRCEAASNDSMAGSLLAIGFGDDGSVGNDRCLGNDRQIAIDKTKDGYQGTHDGEATSKN